MYTKFFSILFVFLISMSVVNAKIVILIDGIDNGRLDSKTVSFSYESKTTSQTVVVLSIKNTNKSFVKEITLVPAISSNATTTLSSGRYILNAFNVATGKSETTYFTVP